jgi:cobalt-zinc-cadmium efflux system outer membrane protein
MRGLSSLVAALVAILLVPLTLACVHVPPKGGFDTVETLTAERGASGAAWSTQKEEQDTALAHSTALLKGELSPEQAVEVALLRNPSLQARYEAIGIGQADLIAAGLPQNPVFSGAIMPRVSPGLGIQESFDLAQNVLQLLLLPARKDLASKEFEATKLWVAHDVIALVASVHSAYYELVARQNLLASLRAIDEANRVSVEYAVGLHAAGNLSDRDLASQQSLREETRLRVLEAQAEVVEARVRLARLLAAQPEEDSWRVPEKLPSLPPSDPAAEALALQAADERLDVLAARATEGAFGQALNLARRWRWIPLLEVGVSSERQPEGGWNVGPSLSLELPIFQQGQTNVARLEAALRRSERELEAARLNARSDVREAAARLAGARARAERLRDHSIPTRERLVELTQQEFNYMLVGAFDLLIAKRDELGTYRAYLEAIRDYWVAFSDLEAGAGKRLEVAQGPASPPSPSPGTSPSSVALAAEPPASGSNMPATSAQAHTHDYHHGDH